jgi:predicted AAA+ superfamily ATPase
MIVRYTQEYLLKLLEYFPIVGVLGSRQVGKTTLVKEVRDKLNLEVVYIDLESTSDLVKLNEPELFFNNNEDKCIIIDEVQRKKEIFPILRSVIDKNKRPARFIITGSASPELIRDTSESLAGRIAYIDLHPFQIEEIGFENIYKHWVRGGFPMSFLAPDDYFSNEWRSNFIRTYIEKDLPLLGLRIPFPVFWRFINILAHINSETINYSNISKSLEFSITTINRYINFLEQSFLIRKIYPYYANVKKRLVKTPKVYFTDTGLLHSLLNIQDFGSLEMNIYLGRSWETYVVNQISFLLKKEFNLFFYRTQAGAEIDLLIEKSGIVYKTIEIKYSNSPKLSKGNINSIEDLNAIENIIITPSSDYYEIKKGIFVMSLEFFILKMKKEKFSL